MRGLTIALAACAFALPVRAQLTTTYAGTQLVGDKQVPATAQFAVENGRVAAIMIDAIMKRHALKATGSNDW